MPKKRSPRADEAERLQRQVDQRLKKIHRTLALMRREAELDRNKILEPIANAIEAYMPALAAIAASHIAARTLMLTALDNASKRGYKKREIARLRKLIDHAENSYRRFTNGDAEAVLNDYWDAFKGLAMLLKDPPPER